MAQLLGPWSPKPFGVLPPALLAAVDRVCRASMPPFSAGVVLVLVDARGQGRMQAIYAAPDGELGRCYDMTLTLAGEVRASNSGGFTTGNAPAPPGPSELRITDVTGSDARDAVQWSMTAGVAGMGIVRVVVDVPGLPPVEASLSDGQFAAWAPGRWTGLRSPPGWRVRGLDATGSLVATAFPP